MSKYKLVIFDWDGTIMDSQARIVSSIQTAAKLANLPIPSVDDAKHIIGLSLPVAVKVLFVDASAKELALVAEHYRSQYVEFDTTPTPLFAGAEKLFNSLIEQGKQLAVATGKSRVGLDHVWQQKGIGHYFVSSRCACEAESKPHPQMILSLLDELKVKPEDAVMIGDTSYDLEMALNAGVDSIGISLGVHDNEVLNQFKPLTIVDSLAELSLHL